MNHPERDEPVYWFVILERARRRGDFGEASRAIGELKRRGVDVKYRDLKPARHVRSTKKIAR